MGCVLSTTVRIKRLIHPMGMDKTDNACLAENLPICTELSELERIREIEPAFRQGC